MCLEQNTFWNNLLSGFLGSVIGASISYIAVISQNRHTSKLQKEAFDEQNRILRDTFENQIKSIRLERKMAEETAFLDKVYNVMQSSKYALSKLQGDAKKWSDKVDEPGFITNLFTFRNEVFELIDNFIEAVEYFDFLDKMVKHFQIRPDFTQDLEGAIQILEKEFHKKYSGYQQSFNQDELAIIKPKLEAVNKLVEEFETWIKQNIVLIMEQRREVLR